MPNSVALTVDKTMKWRQLAA